MAIPKDVNARLYYRVAHQRLQDGKLILDRLGRAPAAIYLTGYAVECIAKALLLSSTSANERAGMLQLFRGGRGHDFAWLRARLAERGCTMPGNIARDWAYVSSWSVDLRYQPGPGDLDEAVQFVKVARVIVDWTDGKM
jgi:HEPN domain